MGEWILDAWKNRIKGTWKLAFLSAVIVGLLTHMFMLANVLPCPDSLMNHYSSQNMVASGRWFLSAACAISSYFDLPWFNGVLGLFFLGLTAAAVSEHFRMRSPVLIVLSSGLLVSFPAVAATLAYSYTFDGYMLSMLLAALAALLSRVEDIRPDRWKRLAAAAVLLCLSCGIYQAYVSFAFMLAVGGEIMALLEGKHRLKAHLRWVGVQVLIFGGALAAYYGVWKLVMVLQGTGATSYQGINMLGSGGLAHLAEAVISALRDTGVFLLQWNIFRYGLTAYNFLNILVLLAFGCGLILGVARSGLRGNGKGIALLILLVVSIPFGCCLWHFASPGVYYHPVMLQSLCLVFILTGVLFDRWAGGRPADLTALLLTAVIFSNSISANIFYDQMHLRYQRSYAAAVELNTRIHLLDDGTVRYIAFLGEPEKPAVEKNVTGALGGCRLPPNGLLCAHFLQLYTDFDLLYYRQTGEKYPLAEIDPENPVPKGYEFRFPLLPAERQQALEASGVAGDMPVWPAAGSVALVGDTVVVRFS